MNLNFRYRRGFILTGTFRGRRIVGKELGWFTSHEAALGKALLLRNQWPTDTALHVESVQKERRFYSWLKNVTSSKR